MSRVMTIRATMRRRLLISYRLDPVVARDLIPKPFRPQLVDGSAVAGVCLIGLESIRPGWFRPSIGLSTENAAHRIAVEWDENGETRSGVYIVERHSSSLVPVIAGGRLFPGVQRHAKFDLTETRSRFRVRMSAKDTRVAADVEVADRWQSSLFPTMDAASEFYRAGAIGWSPRRDGKGVEPLELSSTGWAVEPGRVLGLTSSFFDALPEGAAALDSALVMRDIACTWRVPRIDSGRVSPTVPADQLASSNTPRSV